MDPRFQLIWLRLSSRPGCTVSPVLSGRRPSQTGAIWQLSLSGLVVASALGVSLDDLLWRGWISCSEIDEQLLVRTLVSEQDFTKNRNMVHKDNFGSIVSVGYDKGYTHADHLVLDKIVSVHARAIIGDLLLEQHWKSMLGLYADC